MKVLVIGSGGREHALVWKIAQSPLVKQIFAAPGNGGTALSSKSRNIDLKATEIEKLLDFAIKEKIDLTVVGPEDPLSLGIVDLFAKKGQKIYGPSRKGAMLEASKCFAKEFLKREGIPTPSFKIFNDYDACIKAIDKEIPPIVLKADGLALGKGVKICNSTGEAKEELKSMMLEKSLGEAGRKIILDEFIKGVELSFIAMSDGKNLLPLAPSQDNKRLLDDDKGPNTGGMGAYSPIPFVNEALEKKIMTKIMQKTIDGMAKNGTPFKGTLYAGLIFKGEEPLVLEFNARFGDPETQPLLFRMKSDVVPLLLASVEGNLSKQKIEWEDKTSICVVIASGGYPGNYKKGLPIEGPIGREDGDENSIVFHAGTVLKNGKFFTNGGRVLSVCVKDKSIKAAKLKAIELAEKIKFEGAHFRRDIGDKIL